MEATGDFRELFKEKLNCFMLEKKSRASISEKNAGYTFNFKFNYFLVFL
jgi:hypothetical protein